MNLAQIAAEAGARDLFVLRRIGEDQFFNVGGVGRGDGWAGNVTIQGTTEPWLSRVLAHGVTTRRSGIPFRAFGPYWTTEIAGAVGDDTVVVLAGDGVGDIEPAVLLAIAKDLASSTCEVSIEKREADELELRQVVESVNSITSTPSDEAAREVVGTAVRALSCEFGALVLHGPPPRIFVADAGWTPAATDEELIAAIYPLLAVATSGAFVEQDLSTSPYAYPPLSFADGLVARCTVPVGPGGSLGLVVVAHAGTAPRGFTSLCREVATAIGVNAVGVLRPRWKQDLV